MESRAILLSVAFPLLLLASSVSQDTPKPNTPVPEVEPEAQILGQADLERARHLSDIRTLNAPAFRLKATFSFVGKNLETTQGTYTEVWVSSSQWRRETVVGDLRRVEVGGPTRRWLLDNTKDFPENAARLPDLMNIFPPALTKLEFESVTEGVDEKIPEECVTTKPGVLQERSRYCFDPKSGALLAKLSPEIRSKNTTDYTCFYGAFRKFGNFFFPREMACLEDKHRKLDAKVEELSAEPAPDAALFKPPPGALELDNCSTDLIRPTVVSQVTPNFSDAVRSFPFGNSNPADQGLVTLGLLVDIKGAPQDVTVLHSGGKRIDEAAVFAVQRWRFKPATCNGEPVPTQTTVLINFGGG